MDRLAPSRRPLGRNAGTQRWSELLFAHYEVDPDEVRALLPRGVELGEGLRPTGVGEDDRWLVGLGGGVRAGEHDAGPYPTVRSAG